MAKVAVGALMRAIVFTTLASANDFVQTANAALGYPRDGVNEGGGTYGPTLGGRTTTWATPRKHPTRNEWHVPHDMRLEAMRGAAGRIMPNPISQAKYDAAMAKLDQVVDLPSDWGEGDP